MTFCLPVPTPRYEEEINKRTAAENDFVVLKKVSQEGWQEELIASLAVGSGPWLKSCVWSISLPAFIFLGSIWNGGIKGSRG